MPPLDVRLTELEKRVNHVEDLQGDMVRWVRRVHRCVRWAWVVIGPLVIRSILKYFFPSLPI